MLYNEDWGQVPTTRTDLSSAELDALIRIRSMLQSGEITEFDMGSGRRCIGGYMAETVSGMKVSDSWDRWTRSATGKFGGLFYPCKTNVELTALTRAGAVQAITNFLNGSDTPWL